MRIVTKAFLRYLPRRRGLSVLQLLGIACGVAAAVGMALSAQAALSSFSQAVEFLKGRRPILWSARRGPWRKSTLAKLMTDPAVEFFSPVIDRTVHLAQGETVRLAGSGPFSGSGRPSTAARPRQGDNASTPEEALSFLLEEKAVLVDAQLAKEMGLHSGDFLETNRGKLRVVGTFPNPSSEPLILMDIAHAQRLFWTAGKSGPGGPDPQ